MSVMVTVQLRGQEALIHVLSSHGVLPVLYCYTRYIDEKTEEKRLCYSARVTWDQMAEPGFDVPTFASRGFPGGSAG